MVETLATLPHILPQPQDAAWVTYAAKLCKDEAPLDWRQPAVALARQVRAFNPFPVAQAAHEGEIWRIWMATAEAGEAAPGRVVDTSNGLSVGTGAGLLRVLELQKAGGKRLAAREFLAGNPLSPGARFQLELPGIATI